jgi:hypothetical protein
MLLGCGRDGGGRGRVGGCGVDGLVIVWAVVDAVLVCDFATRSACKKRFLLSDPAPGSETVEKEDGEDDGDRMGGGREWMGSEERRGESKNERFWKRAARLSEDEMGRVKDCMRREEMEAEWTVDGVGWLFAAMRRSGHVFCGHC